MYKDEGPHGKSAPLEWKSETGIDEVSPIDLVQLDLVS